jgi:hypothetical protein
MRESVSVCGYKQVYNTRGIVRDSALPPESDTRYSPIIEQITKLSIVCVFFTTSQLGKMAEALAQG